MLLDELDAMSSLHLYRVLEWSLKYQSTLVLITIANTLDLPERLAPKVYSRLRPERLQMEPYTYAQLTEIMNARLEMVVSGGGMSSSSGSSAASCVNANGIKLAAVRIANETGDVRKALQVCRNAIDRRFFANCRSLNVGLDGKFNRGVDASLVSGRGLFSSQYCGTVVLVQPVNGHVKVD